MLKIFICLFTVLSYSKLFAVTQPEPENLDLSKNFDQVQPTDIAKAGKDLELRKIQSMLSSQSQHPQPAPQPNP